MYFRYLIALKKIISVLIFIIRTVFQNYVISDNEILQILALEFADINIYFWF
jgi:hypothetical protein